VACSCCSGESLDIFGERSARRELRRYLRKGLGGEDARQMAAWAEDTGLEGATVFEVGGGIGQVQAELLRRGAAGGTVVEVVDAYAAPAAELARATGIADKSTFVLADLVATPDAVESADIVVLRRVVCCTPDGPALLGIAAGKARRTLLASYPRDRVITRAFVRVQNGLFALLRKRFRVYVHSPRRLEQVVSERGLRPTHVARGAIWETAQFEHASS
jgi:magnesium-protoporphyrin O-methyltransferase